MTWNQLALFLGTLAIAFGGAFIGVRIRSWFRASAEDDDWPPAEPRGPRSELTIQRGYAAHAADLWRIPVGLVTDDMRKAARRDLFMNANGASRRERQLSLRNNFGLPEIPDDSVLYAPLIAEKDHG